MNFFEDVDENISEKFLEGNIVFIIYEGDKIKGMVNTKEDYEKKVCAHQYTPLLFIVPLHVKLAYLYGCLNHELGVTKQRSYKFMWRTVKTDEWHLWFTIKPYKDSLY